MQECPVEINHLLDFPSGPKGGGEREGERRKEGECHLLLNSHILLQTSAEHVLLRKALQVNL